MSNSIIRSSSSASNSEVLTAGAQPGATGRNNSANASVDAPISPANAPAIPADAATPFNQLYPGGPILANQESDAEPFRPDSQLAARPVAMPPLSSAQLRAIELMVLGRTDTAIADEMGLNRGTVWRWRQHHPLFRAELSRRRQELWGAAGDRFRRTLFAAITTLRKHLRHERALVQFRAARTLLTLAGADRFAPADDSTDPNDYLNEFALLRRKEIHTSDFENDPATDSERKSALATLLAKAEQPESAEQHAI